MNDVTSKIIILSTSHVADDADKWLDNEFRMAMEGRCNTTVCQHRDGWIVFSADLDDLEGVPASLLKVAQWCRSRGISYIRFDSGADTIDELPIYLREHTA